MALKVTILGANSATPAYGRNQTAQLAEVSGQLLLLDCGEGTQMRLMQYRQKISRINHIFISHLHGDHFLGLFGLLSTMNLRGRTATLQIFGPRGLDEIITVQLRCCEMRLSYVINFTEVNDGPSYQVLENDHFTVQSIPMEHRVPCVGYLIREKPGPRKMIKEKLPTVGMSAEIFQKLKSGEDIYDTEGNLLYSNEEMTTAPSPPFSYAYCSDTRFTDSYLDVIKGVDLLYHEATFLCDRGERATETFHCTTAQAGEIAKRAGVHKLLIGHFSARYKDLAPVLAETKAIFENTVLAEEGKSYTPDPKQKRVP